MEYEKLGPGALNQRLLYYPAADKSCRMPVRGIYPERYPQGAVIHFTAGRSSEGDQDAVNTMRYGAEQNHCYFCISSTGTVFQPAPLNQHGCHAGKSSWPGLGEWVSGRLVGIEVCCAGRVEKTRIPFMYRSWFGKKFMRVRCSENRDNIQEGCYHKFTEAQEAALTEFLLWLKQNNPRIFHLEYVLGHDEVSPGRKNDPGGSLSMSMPEYRRHLMKLWQERWDEYDRE